MFFFFAWGNKWIYKVKEEGLRVEKICPECDLRGIFFEVVPTKYFSIFGIPTAATETKKPLLECPNCHERFYIQQSDYLKAFKDSRRKIPANLQEESRDSLILRCENCNQKLKVPSTEKMLKVTCPTCKNTFNFHKGHKVIELYSAGSQDGVESKTVWWRRHSYLPVKMAVIASVLAIPIALHFWSERKPATIAPPIPTQTSIPAATNATEKPQTNSSPFRVTSVPKLPLLLELYLLNFEDMSPEYESAYKLDKKARKYYKSGKYNLAAETFKFAAEKFIDKETLSDKGRVYVKENRISSFENARYSYEMANERVNIEKINKVIEDNPNKSIPIAPLEPANPKRLPQGSSPFGPGIRGGHSTLTVDNGTESDALVTIFRFRDKDKKRHIRNFYVHQGRKWTAKELPAGQYVAKVAFGKDWNSKFRKFNFRRTFSETEPFEITETTSVRQNEDGQITETQFSKMSITLHKVPLGNFKSHEISEEEFMECLATPNLEIP